MKKVLKAASAVFLALTLLTVVTGCGGSGKYTPGTYSASSRGMGGDVVVSLEVSEKKITNVSIDGKNETPGIGGPAMQKLAQDIIDKQSADVEAVSGATMTSNAVIEAAGLALDKAMGLAGDDEKISFNAGTYTGKGNGFYGPVELDVTFSEDKITDIKVKSSHETDHVGTTAFAVLFDIIKDHTTTGVDVVTSSTLTSNAVISAVEDAATQAGCDLTALRKGASPYVLTAGDKIVDSYDVVVIGAGGAGISAAAQAAQNGATVLVLEKLADAGGNTLVSGCSFQSVMECLVWDPTAPDSTTGVYPPTGEVLTKAKSEQGRIDTLKMILSWSEKTFDETVLDPSAISSVDDYHLTERGVHTEYLDTLRILKSQIRAYLAWAEPQIAGGMDETDLTLFSTIELHIFQTYYGSLRLNFDKNRWIYGDFELVDQVCREINPTKAWLIEQGAVFNNAEATRTLIGCLWQRINGFDGGMVNGEKVEGKWGTYFAVPINTILSANDKNEIMYLTTATDLITDADGKVTGVKAVKQDGTELEITADMGVVLATGGYGANLQMVVDNNEYWDSKYLPYTMMTTNRNLSFGEGITMAEKVGADTVGMGFTQLMPISWQTSGLLAYGKGEDVIFVSPAGTPNAGKRYVDESAERDVLAQGAFTHGGDSGLFIQFKNAAGKSSADDIEGQEYFCTLKDASERLGISYDVLKETITVYDTEYREGTLKDLDIPKSGATALIGNYKDDGSFDEEGILSIRYLAPSTHHTMGGLKINTDRQVLTADGQIIDGLYAAGEVTGGIFGGNRLGGNAVTEVLVSGRIAGQKVTGN